MTSRLLLASSFTVALISQLAASASAAVFNFTFDNTFDTTLTPPFVGSGTLSFDGAATVGNYSLASLSNLNMSFSFTNGSSFSLADLTSNFTTSGISIFDLGSGNFGLVSTGTAFLLSKNGETLGFEPTSGVSDPTGCCGGNGVTNLYYLDSTFQGSYNATGAAPTTSVPEPFTIIGTLVGGTAAIRMRKKLKLARTK